MPATYGTYEFPLKTLTPIVSSVFQRNTRGVPWAVLKSVKCRGEIQAANTAAVAAEVDRLIAALNVRGQDFRFSFPDGTTANDIELLSSDSLGGVQVIGYGFPAGEGAEYSVYRKFEFELQAMYRLSNLSASFLWEATENLSFKGTGRKRKRLIQLKNDRSQEQITRRYTDCSATQSGRIVGLFQHLAVPDPIWPSDLDEESAQVDTLDAEERLPDGTAIKFARTYTYTYNRNGPFPGGPF